MCCIVPPSSPGGRDDTRPSVSLCPPATSPSLSQGLLGRGRGVDPSNPCTRCCRLCFEAPGVPRPPDPPRRPGLVGALQDSARLPWLLGSLRRSHHRLHSGLPGGGRASLGRTQDTAPTAAARHGPRCVLAHLTHRRWPPPRTRQDRPQATAQGHGVRSVLSLLITEFNFSFHPSVHQATET